MTLLEQLRANAALAVADRLEAIPHVILPLVTMTHEHVERADLTLWASVDEDMIPQLTIHVEPGLGKQVRFIDLRPADARKLAQHLINFATEIEGAIACSPVPNLMPVKDD